MNSAIGLVQRIVWVGDTVLATIGSTPSSGVSLFVVLRTSDGESVLRAKISTTKLLVKAKTRGLPIEVHYDSNLEFERVSVGNTDICPTGAAIHGDFFGVTGTGIPADARIVFASETAVVTLDPDLVRPHWFFLSELPFEIPAGRNIVYLQAPSWRSAGVPVEVGAGAPQTVRVLYSGQPKARPFTIVLIANPGIRAEDGNIVPDTTLTNGSAYRRAAECCLRSLLTMDEDVLRQFDRDRQIRFVSVIDATLPASDDNTLTEEIAPNIMAPRRALLNYFLSRYGINADIVFVIYGSATHSRNSAHPTTDYVETSENAAGFTFDGLHHAHGRYPRIPGSIAISGGARGASLMPLHEFGHAVSDYNNGRVLDMYVDSQADGFAVNKKWRAQSTDPVPAEFAEYDGADFTSDPGRDGLGYPGDWTSYHPGLIETAAPNLMDVYSPANSGGHASRFDRLTYAWMSDRLYAKLRR